MALQNGIPPAKIPTYPSFATLPALARSGAVAVTLDTSSLYVFDTGTNTWYPPTGGSAPVLTISGSRASPQLIAALSGIPFVSTTTFTKKYIAGDSGVVIVSANPQIAAGTANGQELLLQSRDATNTVRLDDGNGLVLNGPWIGGLDSVLTLTWDTVNWVEKGRQ